MRNKLRSLYRFLPVQLLLLHFRKYQALLLFWLVLFMVITGRFAKHFGAASLFLSPEYYGKIGYVSFFLLGGATGMFVMSWHITTFIIHSKRIPFLGAARHSFLKYCINNSLLPFSYLITFGIAAGNYLHEYESAGTIEIIGMLCGFYAGYALSVFFSFLYFFRADRDIIKSALAKIANPSLIREIIPYDSLDSELGIIKAESYITHINKIEAIQMPYEYNLRFLNKVLRRHHRNAMFAIFTAIAFLIILGAFIDRPELRIPAGASFLILFGILIAAVGAFKYFLRSWEVIGWLLLLFLANLLVKKGIFDLRSIAYGINYEASKPTYDYDALKKAFSDSIYSLDKSAEENRLEVWRQGLGEPDPTLVLISVSGGGSRSAYWTFRCLQYADSLTRGALFRHNVFLSGASGGMIGATYWRSVHSGYLSGQIRDPYAYRFQENIGKDLLNSVIYSLATVDLISPFNKITLGGRRYNKDRGYAFDKELAANTEGLLNYRLKDFKEQEAAGLSPVMIICATNISDGRKLMISSQPIAYLTRSESGLGKIDPIIDAIDYGRFFADQDAMNLQITSALRMGATFPIVLPIVKMPSSPATYVMDAGLRDNFGMEPTIRYLSTFREWIGKRAKKVIHIQIRDTKDYAPSPLESNKSLSGMLLDPLFAIQKKWSSFQTYEQSYFDDYLSDMFPPGQYEKIVFQYVPQEEQKTAALNFHLTTTEKEDLERSINNMFNQDGFQRLKEWFGNGTDGGAAER